MRRYVFVCTFLAVAWAAVAAAQTAARPRDPAWDALKNGNHTQAESGFRASLRARPTDPTLHLGLGIVLHAQGRSPEARGSLARALELEPRLTPAAMLLGQIIYATGDVDGAIAVYDRALKVGRGFPEMQQQLERWRAESSLHAGFQQGGDGRFSVLFEGPAEQALATRVHKVLEAAYWRIGRRLNAYPGETIPVILYTQQQFQDITRSPDWAAGSYDGRIRLAVGSALRTPDALDRVVVHEFVHAVVHSFAPRGVPAWLHEGLAVHFESGDQAWVDAELARAPRTIPLSALEDGFTGLDAATAQLAYAESAAAARVVVNRLGPNLSAMLQSIGSTDSIDSALAVFGFTTADLDTAIRARARGR
jgi:tetratricopeptide (TPR) repeat protein